MGDFDGMGVVGEDVGMGAVGEDVGAEVGAIQTR